MQDVVEALRPHGLTLQNYASVREQQIGGFTQVSAHGTGCKLPPVDEQLVSVRMVSPGSGSAVTMEKGKDAAFDWVKVGLGSMGVVTEVTLQCVPAHKLIEKTFVATREEVKRKHKQYESGLTASLARVAVAKCAARWMLCMQVAQSTQALAIHVDPLHRCRGRRPVQRHSPHQAHQSRMACDNVHRCTEARALGSSVHRQNGPHC